MQLKKKHFAALAFYLYNSFVTHCPFYLFRHFYLRRVLKIQLGRSSAVHMGCFLTGKNIVIGSNCVINRNCYIDGRSGVVIGDNVSISPEVYILSLDHDPNSPDFAVVMKQTVIGEYSWIGVRSLILPGIHLGKGTVVGAGAVVTKNTESFTIVAGVPAKVIGQRNSNLSYSPSYFPYFNTDIL